MSQYRVSTDQKKNIVLLLDQGLSRSEVATKIGVNWKQVDYWSKNRARVIQLVEIEDLKSSQCRFESDLGHQYVYLLGCYLGDGYINKQGSYTWKIRYACDLKYPGIISEIRTALETFGNTSGVTPQTNAQCVDVYTHSNQLPRWFPQHGRGRKHTRDIVLEEWQYQLVGEYPWDFIRGMYHTDGSRYLHKQGGRAYVKYNFTNRSTDIIRLFCHACDIAGVGYNVCSRPGGGFSTIDQRGWTVTIGRKSEVAKCEEYLGPKT